MFEIVSHLDNKTKEWKWQQVSFFSVLIVMFLFLQIKNVNEYYYDSIYYSGIAETIVGDGQNHDSAYYDQMRIGGFHINLLNYPETFRGYLWPTIIGLTRGACIVLFHNGYIGWRIIASFMMAIILTWALPGVFMKRILSLGDFLRVIIMFIVVCIYWGDFLAYPLSDMAAFGFMCCGVALLRQILDETMKVKWKLVIRAIIAGICFYASYNTRVAYLYSFIAVLAVLGYQVCKEKQLKKSLIMITSIFIGMLLIAAPQMAINHKYTGSYTPRVITEQYVNYENGLEWLQVWNGIEHQRYESFVGESDEYPSEIIYFEDPVGKELIERENITSENFGYGKVIRLFFKYPLDVVGIYFRHLINLLTPIYDEVYITNVHTSKGLFVSCAIWMWLIACLMLGVGLKNKKINIFNVCICSAIVISNLLQCMGQPELRFFIGVYMLMYFFLFVKSDWIYIWDKINKNKVAIICILCIVFLLWTTIVGDVLSRNEYEILLIHDKIK